MNRDQILKLPSMPAASPSYPVPPFRFINREYMIVMYESDPEAIRAAVPEPLIPDPSNQVFYEWIRMPDSSGFGDRGKRAWKASDYEKAASITRGRGPCKRPLRNP